MLEVEFELATSRLLTLTGAGGSGKTRLALEVARALSEAYPDGVWLVELAPLSEEALVPKAVAEALAVFERPQEPLADTLADVLRDRQLLLVLDNCEHLIEAAAGLVDALLDSCPRVRILATSREGLGLEGELRWAVAPLSMPESQGTPSSEELEGYESVRLFVERARGRDPAFSLSLHNALTVSDVCRRLEGIPLAIELAAAMAGTLSVEQISERLNGSLELLTHGGRTAVPRQRTLKGTLEWSYDLLSEPERALFRRLSTFAGGWTLGAAEAVGQGEDIEGEDVLDLLSSLVDKSLVMSELGGESKARYRMLELIRQYAKEKLDESGEAERVRRRHTLYHLALAERAEPKLRGPEQSVWLELLVMEHDNLRAALSWALDPRFADREERAELGLRLAASLWLFWNIHGFREGHRWLEAALELGSLGSRTRAKALNGVGWITLYRGDYERAVARLGEGLSLSTELGDKEGAAVSLAYLGRVVIHQGDEARAAALREEAETFLRRYPLNGRARAELISFLAMAALDSGDRERSVTLFEESLSLFRELGDVRGIVRGTFALGLVALERGEHERAWMLLAESLRPLRGLPDKMGIAYGLLGLAGVAGARGDPARAGRLWGAAEALRKEIGLPLSYYDRSHYDYEGRLATARSRLDGAAWEAAWSEGRSMSPVQAVEYALSQEGPTPPSAPASTPRRSYPADLSVREVEVLVLVAEGITSAQVAHKLFLSPRTVHKHLSSIYRKLGVSSRVAATRFAVEHGLV